MYSIPPSTPVPTLEHNSKFLKSVVSSSEAKFQSFFFITHLIIAHNNISLHGGNLNKIMGGGGRGRTDMGGGVVRFLI